MCFWPPTESHKNGPWCLEHFFRDKEPPEPVLGLSPWVGIFLPVSAQRMLRCLWSTCIIWHLADFAVIALSPTGRGQTGSFYCSTEEIGKLPCDSRGKRAIARGGLSPTKLILLSLLCVSKALFRSGLDCAVFSVTPILRCGKQRCLDVYFRWLALWCSLLSSCSRSPPQGWVTSVWSLLLGS